MKEVKHEIVKKGDKVPFDGILLTQTAVAKIISNYEHQMNMLVLENEKLSRITKAEKESNKSICSANLVEFKTKVTSCQGELERQKRIFYKQLEKCDKKTPWYANPYASFIVGGLIVGGVCVAVDRAN